MATVLLVHHVGRQRLGVVLAIGRVLEALVAEEVGHAVEGLLLAQRQLEHDEAGSEPSPQVGQDLVEIGPLLVLAWRRTPSADVALDASGPRCLGAHLDAVDGADDDHGQVGDREGGLDVAPKSA